MDKPWTNFGQTLDKVWTFVQVLSKPPSYTSTDFSTLVTFHINLFCNDFAPLRRHTASHHRFTQLLATAPPHSAANWPHSALRSRAKKVLQSLFCCTPITHACGRAADQRKRKFTLHCIISSLAFTVGQPHTSRRNRRATEDRLQFWLRV